MSKVTNHTENAKSLFAYEQHLRSQLMLINQIKICQARLAAIPTSNFYNLMGSQSEMQEDVRTEQMILDSLRTKLVELIEGGVIV